MLTDTDKTLLKLIASIALVVLWMVLQSFGWSISFIFFLAIILQWPPGFGDQPVQMAWRDVPKLILIVAAMFAINWTWNRFVTTEQAYAMAHSPLFVLGSGTLYISLMIRGWLRRQRNDVEAPP